MVAAMRIANADRRGRRFLPGMRWGTSRPCVILSDKTPQCGVLESNFRKCATNRAFSEAKAAVRRFWDLVWSFNSFPAEIPSMLAASPLLRSSTRRERLAQDDAAGGRRSQMRTVGGAGSYRLCIMNAPHRKAPSVMGVAIAARAARATLRVLYSREAGGGVFAFASGYIAFPLVAEGEGVAEQATDEGVTPRP